MISPFSLTPFAAPLAFLTPLFGLLGLLPPSSFRLFDVAELDRTLGGLPGTLLGGGIDIAADEAVRDTTLGPIVVCLRDMLQVGIYMRVEG